MRREKILSGGCLVAGVCAVLAAATGASAAVTGQWDFNDAADGLKATVGHDLVYGDAGQPASVFGKTSALGIAKIQPTDAAGNPVGAATDADVMQFPGFGSSSQGYKMYPGAAANGAFSGGDVNQYTMVWDVYYPSSSNNTYRALLQTSATNGNDADFFIGNGTVAPSPNGVGISGVYNGTILPDTWYRIALVVNLDVGTGNQSFFKYINGNLVGSQSLVNSRWSVWAEGSGNPSWIFSDNDGDTAMGYADHVAFFDSALSANDVAALGGLTNAVPEPASLLLVGMGVTALIRRRARA